MDQRLIWAGQVPLVADGLLPQQYSLRAITQLAAQIYGASVPSATGLAIWPSSTDLTFTVGPGSVLAPAQLRPIAMSGGAALGGLDADTTTVLKQFSVTTNTVLTLPGNNTTYWLYAVCSDVDTDSTLLPFYNASDPAQTQAGQNNSGTPLPSRRSSQISLIVANETPEIPVGGVVVQLATVIVPAGATTATAATFTLSDSFWSTIPELQAQIAAAIVNLNAEIDAVRPGRFLNSRKFTSDTTYIPSSGTRYLRVRGVGGGGAGGGAAANSTQGSVSAGGGGAAGAFIEFWVAASALPGTGVSLTCGAGGAPPATGTLAGAGGSSSFGDFVTLGGGSGGWFGVSMTSSSAAAASYGGRITYSNKTPLDIRVEKSGSNGATGQTFGSDSNLSNWPGLGADSPLGGGGTNSNNGSGEDADGNGSGGGGAGSNSTTAYPGGSGAPGCWIIEEYS